MARVTICGTAGYFRGRKECQEELAAAVKDGHGKEADAKYVGDLLGWMCERCGEVTIGTATNVDVGENEGKSKNDAANGGYGGDGGTGDELYGLHQNDLNTEKFKMTSYQFILDNETPW